MKTEIYTHKGTKKGAYDAPETVFGQKWNADLVHQVVVSSLSNARQGSAHTKDRSEVRGGGRKPWRQKGTGRARHGSSRSPIWIGGGVTFGPRNDKNYDKKINRKAKMKALAIALSAKLRDNELVFVEALDQKSISTKAIADTLKGLEKIKGFETINTPSNPRNILMILPEANDVLYKSLRNITHVNVRDARSVNTLDIAQHRYIVVADPVIAGAVLEGRITNTSESSLNPKGSAKKDSAKTE